MSDYREKFREVWERRHELSPENRAKLDAMVERTAAQESDMDRAMEPIWQRYAAQGITAADAHANEGRR